MAQDIGVWTWPVDVAARQSNAMRWALLASLLYCLGTFALMLRGGMDAGLALMLGGVAASVYVLGRVLLTRLRLAGAA